MQRDRLTRHFLKHNADTMSDAELLELLLRFAGENAAQRTQALFDRFPSVATLFEAELQELLAVEGMDEDAAMLVRLLPELQRRYFLSRVPGDQRLLDAADYGNYLLPYYLGAKNEMVYLLCMDALGKPLSCRKIGEGSANSANVPPRRMVQEALAVNASMVVLAHNHPCAVALPSRQDVELTMRLKTALEAMNIELRDHMIIADDDFVSMRESGYFC